MNTFTMTLNLTLTPMLMIYIKAYYWIYLFELLYIHCKVLPMVTLYHLPPWAWHSHCQGGHLLSIWACVHYFEALWKKAWVLCYVRCVCVSFILFAVVCQKPLVTISVHWRTCTYSCLKPLRLTQKKAL